MVVGQNEELLKVRIADKAIDKLAIFERDANIDGVQKEAEGTYLVSDFRGKLFRVTSTGVKTTLIDTSTPVLDIADFAYIPGKSLIVIPILRNNSVAAYSIGKP